MQHSLEVLLLGYTLRPGVSKRRTCAGHGPSRTGLEQWSSSWSSGALQMVHVFTPIQQRLRNSLGASGSPSEGQQCSWRSQSRTVWKFFFSDALTKATAELNQAYEQRNAGENAEDLCSRMFSSSFWSSTFSLRRGLQGRGLSPEAS